MVLPYGQKKDLLRFLVEGTYLVHEVRHIIYSLRTHAVEKPRSKDGAKVYASLGPSMTTVSEIQKSVLATKKHHLFAYFCLQGIILYHIHTRIILFVSLCNWMLKNCICITSTHWERDISIFLYLYRVSALRPSWLQGYPWSTECHTCHRLRQNPGCTRGDIQHCKHQAIQSTYNAIFVKGHYHNYVLESLHYSAKESHYMCSVQRHNKVMDSSYWEYVDWVRSSSVYQ